MKRIDKIAQISIIITIILLSINIGSNIKEPIWLIQSFVCIITTIYIITKKIQKEKNVIIKGKIDIAVLSLMVSTTIPLIVRKYASLEGTINFILKYWSVYGIYILSRNTIKEKSQIKTIIKTVIISSIIPIIFGYDKILNINIFQGMLDKINAVKIEDVRMISTFGYANTFAIYLTLTTILAIGILAQESKKRNKILYTIYIIISIITIILTQSKAVLALIAIVTLIFIIKATKEKRISKKWILIGAFAIILFLIYFLIAIKIPKTSVITEKEKTYVIRGIEKNKAYDLEFNIDAQSDKQYDSFQIVVVEITKYLGEKQLGIISFGEYKGTKSVNIETDELASHLEIRVVNKLKQTIKINQFKINNNKYILEYKIIPDEIVRVFTTFNLKNTSVFQRLDYWNDALKIIKDNWIFGAGGNAWRNLYGQYQEYLYYAKESHSYILEIWMSYGIVGIISYIFIIAITIENSKGNIKDKTMLSIIVGTILILIHSIMDFDMSYLIMQMIVFMCIAIINKDDKNIQIKSNIIEYLISLMFIIITISNSLALITTITEDKNGIPKVNLANWISRYQYNEIIANKENSSEKIKRYIKNEPYSRQNIMYKLLSDSIIQNNNKTDLEFLVKTLKQVKVERKYEINQLESRSDIIINLYEKTKNKEELKDKELLNIIIKEYPEYSKCILEYPKNLEGKTISDIKYKNYTQNYERAKNLYIE